MTQQSNGLFIQEQEDLTEDVYDVLIYKPKQDKIKQEMSKWLETHA